jgi:hypothetical protein
LIERDGRAVTGTVTELLVRPTLPDFGRAEIEEDGNDFRWFENRNVAHDSCDGDVLDANKLRFQGGLAVFEKHAEDFLKVMVYFIQRFPLRMSAREARNKPDKHAGLRASLDYRRIDFHGQLQNRMEDVIIILCSVISKRWHQRLLLRPTNELTNRLLAGGPC